VAAEAGQAKPQAPCGGGEMGPQGRCLGARPRWPLPRSCSPAAARSQSPPQAEARPRAQAQPEPEQHARLLESSSDPGVASALEAIAGPTAPTGQHMQSCCLHDTSVDTGLAATEQAMEVAAAARRDEADASLASSKTTVATVANLGNPALIKGEASRTSGGSPQSTDTAAEDTDTPVQVDVPAALGLGPSAAPAPPKAESSTVRRQLDLETLEEALEVAIQSAAAESAAEWDDNTFEQTMKLRHFLTLVAQPEFDPPPRFQQAMDTCMACLLHAPQGRLMHAKRMAELLDSPDFVPTLRYLDWLEGALREVSPCSSGSASCRTVLVPQRVRSALSSWPAERALLQQSATALWEALLAHGPEHHRSCVEWRKATRKRQQIQAEQEGECLRVARELEDTVNFLVNQLVESSGTEWPHLARASQDSLQSLQQLTGDLLQSQQESWSYALEEYEALGAHASACRAVVCEHRRQVRRCEQAFGQATQRFGEVASQLVAWTSVLVPKLRLLAERRAELREAVALQQRLPALERESLAAEDELDAAQTELRKHRRHTQASRALRSPRNPAIGATAGAVLERQYELRVTHAGERVHALSEQLQEAEKRLQEAETALPLILDPDEEGGGAGTPCSPRLLSPEERLALKLATLEQFHEDVAVQVSEVQAERDRVLQQVTERKAEEALRRRVEPDFMCPIMHERMQEPVLAADGHTYERQAIEKWLQMHNTSPMTGAPLAHRYLTENFALRHLIASCDAGPPASFGCSSQDCTGEAASIPSSVHPKESESEENEGEEEDDYSEDEGLGYESEEGI